MKQTMTNIAGFLFLFTVAGAPAQSPDLDTLMERARSGDAEAQFRLGSAYDSGTGVPRDGSLAIKWYLQAADSGHAEAQNSLGSIYQAERNFDLALRWYSESAKQDHSLALNNLGNLYYQGWGVARDDEKAYELFMRSAHLGWAEAMWNIANMHGAGDAGEVDYAGAYVWCLRARKYMDPGWRGELVRVVEQCIKQSETVLPDDELYKARIESESWEPGG